MSALRLLLLTVLAALGVGFSASPAASQPAPPSPSPTEFRAQAEPDKSDIKGLLASCDQQLIRCEKDKTGVSFLGAAYIALWVILLAFFWMARRRQARLLMEMNELKLRLAKLSDAGIAGS